MTDAPPSAGSRSRTSEDDEASWQAAKLLRRDHPRWVVIWVARTGRFHGYPLFRTQRETALSAAQPGNLAAQMDAVEQAAPRSRAGQRRASTTTS